MQVYSSFNSGKHKNYYKQPLRKSKRFYLFLLIVIIISCFVIWAIAKGPDQDEQPTITLDETAEPETAKAKVEYLNGQLQIKIQDNWQDLKVNDFFEPGAQIKTNDNSKATIVLPEGSLVRLDQNTQLNLIDFGQADIVIEQACGTAFYRVNESSPAIFRVINKQVELTALGTGFNVNIDNSKVNLIVTESRVKAKIYETEQKDNILSMRTIDEGYYAIIDPGLENEKMIESDEKNLAELLNHEWLMWNKEQDEAQNFYLGVFAKSIELQLSEPQETEFETDQDTLTIKGTTDSQAQIYINSQEIDNDNGEFSTEIELDSGDNQIEILVQKEKNKNKKTLYVKSTKQVDGSIELTAEIDQNNVNLTWQVADTEALYGFRTIKSTAADPVFPDNTYHKIGNNTYQDSWTDLESGTYHFRVCLYENQGCTLYSNDVKATIEAPTVTVSDDAQIALSSQPQNQNVNLSWSTKNIEGFDNFQILINTATDPSYPACSSHVLDANARSDTWQGLDPGTYYFRVCAFADNKCILYSNNSFVTIEKLTAGPAQISLSGSCQDNIVTLDWTAANLTADKGFYAVTSLNSSPTFPGSTFKLLSSNSDSSVIWDNLKAGKTYYFRVCENIGSTCGTYSNQISLQIK